MATVTIHGGNAPLSVQCGQETAGALVQNLSGATLYYSQSDNMTPDVSGSAGSIAVGGSTTLYGAQYFATARTWVNSDGVTVRSPRTIVDVVPASLGAPVQTGLSNTFTANNVFQTGATFGPISPDPRQPVATRIAINPSQSGTSDHIGHLLKTVVDGPWAEVSGDDPNIAWGMNVFTLYQNNQNGLALGYGALIEADVSSPSGVTLTRITGLQAEASFFGASAGATVGTMESMYVAPPVRKNGATAGTATNVYGLRIGIVRASNVGATSAYGLFVQGIGSSAGTGQSLLQGTVNINAQNAADVGIIVKQPATPTVDVFQIKDSGSAILGRFDKSGYFMTKKTSVPADADLTNGELAFWLDATVGATKAMFKAKDTAGTVRTAAVALA